MDILSNSDSFSITRLKRVKASVHLLEYEIDGTTLKMMNSVERISLLIPSFKQHLIFLEEREKLFKHFAADSMTSGDTLSKITTNRESLDSSSTDASASSTLLIGSQLSSFVHQNTSCVADSLELSINNFAVDRSDRDMQVKTKFPDDYKVPSLPSGLMKDVNDGVLTKFGPHCAYRRILIDGIADDIIHNYNLL